MLLFVMMMTMTVVNIVSMNKSSQKLGETIYIYI